MRIQVSIGKATQHNAVESHVYSQVWWKPPQLLKSVQLASIGKVQITEGENGWSHADWQAGKQANARWGWPRQQSSNQRTDRPASTALLPALMHMLYFAGACPGNQVRLFVFGR